MATLNTVTILHPVKVKTPAERAAAYRLRKKSRVSAEMSPPVCDPKPVTPVTPAPSRPKAAVTPVTPSRGIAPILLTGTAFGLAGVALVMNGWYSHSLGSTPVSAWVFAAVGVAADAVALALPACVAAKWQARQRGAALAGWLIWLLTFAFTTCAGIGFASVNVTDVTASRAAIVTPAVTAAQAQLADVMATRDRECKTGTGKNCRAREDAVATAQQGLNAAMASVERRADPQTLAASKIVTWLSAGLLSPSGDDFAMLRLILLALLPQLGGVLLMIARRP